MHTHSTNHHCDNYVLLTASSTKMWPWYMTLTLADDLDLGTSIYFGSYSEMLSFQVKFWLVGCWLYWVQCHFNSYGHIIAVSDTHIFPGFLTPVITQLSFQSHRLLFSHASAEVRGENMPQTNFASTEYQTHNHQVTSPTRSPLSHPGMAV